MFVNRSCVYMLTHSTLFNCLFVCLISDQNANMGIIWLTRKLKHFSICNIFSFCFAISKCNIGHKPLYVWIGIMCVFVFVHMISGRVDLCRCYLCGLGLKDWSINDDVLFVHLKYSPNCKHLTETVDSNILSVYRVRGMLYITID